MVGIPACDDYHITDNIRILNCSTPIVAAIAIIPSVIASSRFLFTYFPFICVLIILKPVIFVK